MGGIHPEAEVLPILLSDVGVIEKKWGLGDWARGKITTYRRRFKGIQVEAALLAHLQLEIAFEVRTVEVLRRLKHRAIAFLKGFDLQFWSLREYTDLIITTVAAAMAMSEPEKDAREFLRNATNNESIHKAHSMAKGDLGRPFLTTMALPK